MVLIMYLLQSDNYVYVQNIICSYEPFSFINLECVISDNETKYNDRHFKKTTKHFIATFFTNTKNLEYVLFLHFLSLIESLQKNILR